MNANILGDAASLYLRMARRVKRAGLDPLDHLVEAAVWGYAQRAASRLERLRQSRPVPVLIKRRRDAFSGQA